MNGLKTICHCGHDVDTHFERRNSCLATACECTRYRDHLKPLPPWDSKHTSRTHVATIDDDEPESSPWWAAPTSWGP